MRVMVTGHRPPKVGGYRLPNPTEQWVRTNLRAILKGMLERDEKLEAVTGMALGADTIFAEVCLELGIPFIAATPFKDQGSRWPTESQEKLARLLAAAKKVVIVDEIPSYHSDRFGGKMALRNKWMVDHSAEAIAVWDGTDGGTANAVKLLRKKSRKFLLLDPRTSTVSIEEPPDSGPDVFDMFG
jgi:uncharacterized phage-like protein YoqJ